MLISFCACEFPQPGRISVRLGPLLPSNSLLPAFGPKVPRPHDAMHHRLVIRTMFPDGGRQRKTSSCSSQSAGSCGHRAARDRAWYMASISAA